MSEVGFRYLQSVIQINGLNLQPPVVRAIMPLLWRESDSQKLLAIMKGRMVLLHHCGLWIIWNAVTQQYSNRIPKVCPMLSLHPPNSPCAACRRMLLHERRKGAGTAPVPALSQIARPPSSGGLSTPAALGLGGCGHEVVGQPQIGGLLLSSVCKA